jgi:hypothetical protein
MITHEDIGPGLLLNGSILRETVAVVAVARAGQSSIRLTYRLTSGAVLHRFLSCQPRTAQEGRLESREFCSVLKHVDIEALFDPHKSRSQFFLEVFESRQEKSHLDTHTLPQELCAWSLPILSSGSAVWRMNRAKNLSSWHP